MSTLRYAMVVAVVAAMANVAFGGHVLMSTDGYYVDNAQRAGELGHTVATAALADINAMSAAELAVYDAIWVNPGFGPASYDDLRAGVDDTGSLAEYAAEGGMLVLNVAGNWGSQMNIAPDSIAFIDAIHNAETIDSPSHQIITGDGYGGHALTAADFASWYQTDHGYLSGLPFYATTILRNTDGPSLAEYPHGTGKVLVSTLAVGWAMAGEARGTAQDNMINYVLVPEPATLGLLAIGGLLLVRRR